MDPTQDVATQPQASSEVNTSTPQSETTPVCVNSEVPVENPEQRSTEEEPTVSVVAPPEIISDTGHTPTSTDSEMKDSEGSADDLESTAHDESNSTVQPETTLPLHEEQSPAHDGDSDMVPRDEIPIPVDPQSATLDISHTEAVLTSSLALIADYGISSDSDSDDSTESSSSSSSSSEDEVQVVDTVSYRNTVNVISSADEDSEVEVIGCVEEGEANKRRPKKVIKAKGEMGVEDLPPIEDLNISVPEHECLELGTVMSIVDQLVLVESKAGSIALDLDTVLFLDHGQRTLGRIFDVLGQVHQPLYCVRFNSAEHIKEKDIVAGMKVYYNNQRPEHTSVVVLPNLMRYRGSDASWDHDIEPPEGCLEYSDDEQERSARKARKAGHRAIPEDPNQQRMKRAHPSNMNHRGRVRNPFAMGGGGGPRPVNNGGQNVNNSWRNNHQGNNNNNQQQQHWPQSQPGYGNNYANHSWHTYYQQYPPPPQPHQMPPGPPPFYMNPYAQGGPPQLANGNPQPPPGWNSNGNYYYQQGGPSAGPPPQ